MKISTSNMLEMTLKKINQTYEIESIQSKLRCKGNIIRIEKTLKLPEGSFIKISDSRYNNGIFEVIGAGNRGYKLDKELINGMETAIVSPLNVPAGLIDIVKQMCVSADEIADGSLESISVNDIALKFNENELFKQFSGMLAAYKRLKTL